MPTMPLPAEILDLVYDFADLPGARGYWIRKYRSCLEELRGQKSSVMRDCMRYMRSRTKYGVVIDEYSNQEYENPERILYCSIHLHVQPGGKVRVGVGLSAGDHYIMYWNPNWKP